MRVVTDVCITTRQIIIYVSLFYNFMQISFFMTFVFILSMYIQELFLHCLLMLNHSMVISRYKSNMVELKGKS
jgi:hypothetical protein